MRIQKSTDKEDFGRKGLFRADSLFKSVIYFKMVLRHPKIEDIKVIDH
ncbi:MAG: hypothetical protein JJU02_14835 [Cryomorphaceae bacterium]|nr:hypothetical protein [Cryomorphaceae bacterium]